MSSGAALRGTLFGACLPAGVAPGTAVGTTAALVLYNPAGSGVKIALRKVSAGYLSGTLGAGTLFHCVNPTTTQTAPSGGTAVTGLNLDAGRANAPVAAGLVSFGATVVAPTATRPFCSLSPILASSVVQPFQLEDDLTDEIILEPGTSYQIQAVAAAGSSPKIVLGIIWEE